MVTFKLNRKAVLAQHECINCLTVSHAMLPFDTRQSHSPMYTVAACSDKSHDAVICRGSSEQQQDEGSCSDSSRGSSSKSQDDG